MNFLKNFFFFFLLLIFLNSCAILPGINNGPSKKNSKAILDSEYTIEDVAINIVKINSLTENDFRIIN